MKGSGRISLKPYYYCLLLLLLLGITLLNEGNPLLVSTLPTLPYSYLADKVPRTKRDKDMSNGWRQEFKPIPYRR